MILHKEPLVSVIVPIYNVEIYLSKCIKSILEQTYRNIEVILVNDGSSDKSREICLEFAEQDSRIKLVHQKNGGLSSARNTGIDYANGEFLSFIDSDDFIHPKMYEIMVRNLILHNADLSICDFKKVYASNIEEISSEKLDMNYETFICTKEEAFEHLYGDLSVRTVVAWNKLYKAELFSTIKYPVGKIHEDEFIIHHLLNLTEKIVYVNLPLYFYLQREDSIINQKYNMKRLHSLEAYKDRIMFFEQNGYKKFLINSNVRYLSLIATQYFLVKKHFPENQKIKKQLKNEYRMTFIKNKKNLNNKDKFESYLFMINGIFYRVEQKLYKKIIRKK